MNHRILLSFLIIRRRVILVTKVVEVHLRIFIRLPPFIWFLGCNKHEFGRDYQLETSKYKQKRSVDEYKKKKAEESFPKKRKFPLYGLQSKNPAVSSLKDIRSTESETLLLLLVNFIV